MGFLSLGVLLEVFVVSFSVLLLCSLAATPPFELNLS